ncbi:MAG TPA: hypothetical protein VF746_22190 [Longimicrobium sp.]|jgi:hypothetical protein
MTLEPDPQILQSPPSIRAMEMLGARLLQDDSVFVLGVSPLPHHTKAKRCHPEGACAEAASALTFVRPKDLRVGTARRAG